jgi:hypothetical protein
MKRTLAAVVIAAAMAGCAAPAAPTPLTVFVTPEPTTEPTPEIIYVTPAPTPTPTPEPTPAPAPVSYKPIVVKTTTDKVTAPFHIGTNAVTLSVTAHGGPLVCDYALVAAFLYPAGETAMYVGDLSTEVCATTVETEVYLEPGDYYLNILVANVRGTVIVKPHN